MTATNTHCPLSKHSNRARSTASIAFNGHNHIVESAKIQPGFFPSIEVVSGSDSPTGTLRCADRPVLIKDRSAHDRSLVDSRRLADVIGAAVALNRADLGDSRGWVVGTVRFHNVEFDKRVFCPAIYGQVSVATGFKVPRVRNSARIVMLSVRQTLLLPRYRRAYVPSTSGVPTLSTNKVAAVGPVNTVRASVAIGISNRATTISPKRVVVATAVPSLTTGNRLALKQVALRYLCSWCCKHPGDNRKPKGEGCEGYHDCKYCDDDTILSIAAVWAGGGSLDPNSSHRRGSKRGFKLCSGLTNICEFQSLQG